MARAKHLQLNWNNGKLIACVSGKERELTYEQAFSLGHSLLQAKQCKRARDVFAVLARTPGRGSRAKLMLARSEAEIDNFSACAEILHTIFQGENEPVAASLQGAFVFHTIGLREDAIREMLKVVNEHPDVPTPCLFLGDLFREVGKMSKASRCWKLAIKRDRRGGSVAIAARKELDQLAKRVKKNEAEKPIVKKKAASKSSNKPPQ